MTDDHIDRLDFARADSRSADIRPADSGAAHPVAAVLQPGATYPASDPDDALVPGIAGPVRPAAVVGAADVVGVADSTQGILLAQGVKATARSVAHRLLPNGRARPESFV